MKQMFVNMILVLEAMIKEDKHKNMSVFDQNSQKSPLHSSKLMVCNLLSVNKKHCNLSIIFLDSRTNHQYKIPFNFKAKKRRIQFQINKFRNSLFVLVQQRKGNATIKKTYTVLLIEKFCDNSRCRVSLLHLLVDDPGLQDPDLLLVAGGHLQH